TAVDRPEAITAALPALRAAGAMSVVATFDSVRATAARFETLAVGHPSGPVALVAAPEEALPTLGPLFADLAVAKVGADLKALRVALGRRGLALAGLSTEFGTALERLMTEIYALAGCEFNISSPPQLRTVLFERLNISTRGVRRGKTGLSTDVDVLRRLAAEHPLPAKILEYRALAKLK